MGIEWNGVIETPGIAFGVERLLLQGEEGQVAVRFAEE